MSTTNKVIRDLYIKLLRNRIKNPMLLHRLKMIYFSHQYFYLLGGKISKHRFKIFTKFIRIDFGILHAHQPIDFLCIASRIINENDNGNQKGIIIEAGCWNGGSSAKLSVMAELSGRTLQIYDSFEGVEPIGLEDDKSHDYSYEYSSSMENTKSNIQKYGMLNVCSFHKGYFEHSFINYSTPFFLCYIDCDLAKGTSEVIKSILPYTVNTSYIFSQDYAIRAVKELLDNEVFFDDESSLNNLRYTKSVYTNKLVEFKFKKQHSGK